MENTIRYFEGHEITFDFNKNNLVMINATQMAKPFGKKVNDFMSNEKTKFFIKEILNHNEKLKYINISSKNDLYRSNQKTGTWMHRILALKFAGWLSPAFEIWIYNTIETILVGKLIERLKSLERSLRLQTELQHIKDKIQKTGEDFERYLEIERQLKHERSIRKSLTSESMSSMKDMFENMQQPE